jgi:probable rRNA maturation factor
LVVHGVLHLAGYDHERPRDAKRMGPLEVKILKALGIADPYAATDTAPKTAKVK